MDLRGALVTLAGILLISLSVSGKYKQALAIITGSGATTASTGAAPRVA